MLKTEQGEDLTQTGRQQESCTCSLAADEKARIAMELAKAYQELESLAIDKKKVIAEFESHKEKLRQQIHLLSQKIKEGIEM
jgi:phage shock protein A